MSTVIFRRMLACSVAVFLQSNFAYAGEGTSASAQGQESQQPMAAPSSVRAAAAQDIVVTAQRRAEPLQKVPIAITAIQPMQLEEQNVTDLVSLRTTVATFDYKNTGINSGIYIRGIGQDGGFANNENSVALYVDDVYLGVQQMTKMAFNNIEQLVVLKGPQGTLFGRNATGGVVQIMTATPEHDPGIDASIGYGNFDTVKGTFYATGGLGENMAANFSLIYENQNDGWGRNLFLDEDVLYKKQFGARTKVLFEPSEGTEIVLSADYNYERNSGLNQHPGPGNTTFGPAYPPEATRFDTFGDFPETDWIRHGGGSLKLTQELGFGNLVSITAYRKMKALQAVDQDATPASIVSVFSYFRASQFTQEVQLLSSGDSKLKWTLGAFYLHATPFYGQDFLQISRHTESKQLTNSIAVYGQVTYPIFEGTNLTGGLRYTHETQKLVDSFQEFGGTTRVDIPDNKTKFSKPTWRISLDHQFTDDILGYFSYNRGIKTGGFNMGSPASPAYFPEKLDAYEVGLKTQLFDRRVRFNVAAFYYDYTNLQVSQAAQGTAFLSNAATARIKGIDGDIDIRATDELSLFGSFGILDSEYTSFPNSVAFAANGARVGDPLTGLDVSGNETTYAPDFTGSAGARYHTETKIGKITLSANVNYFGGSFTTPDNFARIPAYTLVNASVQWTSPSEMFDVRLWGANLTDTHYLSYAAQNAVGLMIRPGQPRTYGVSIGVHY